MSGNAENGEALERALIAAAGLDATFAAYPAEVLSALRAARALHGRLLRPESPAVEPATVFRPPVQASIRASGEAAP